MTDATYPYQYFVPDHGETVDDACTFKSYVQPGQPELMWVVAEVAAEHEYKKNPEATWPLTLELLSSEGAPLGRFGVEFEPGFMATKLEAADEEPEKA